MFENEKILESLEQTLGNDQQRLDRRNILKMGLVGILASVTPLLASAPAKAANFSSWRVSFRQSHTGESFSGVYRVGNRYLPEAFDRLNYVLRDFRTDEVFPMDPRVLDIMCLLQQKVGGGRPLEVLSGYRSPQTNNTLRHVSTGVARNSFHMYGQALDIRVKGYSTSKLRSMAKGLKAGGVGYYPKSDFVHVDTGQIRSW
jgi:uncharacterized protein YcbK (DUF882 family)